MIIEQTPPPNSTSHLASFLSHNAHKTLWTRWGFMDKALDLGCLNSFCAEIMTYIATFMAKD